MHKRIVALTVLAASASFAASVTVAGNAFTHTFGTGDQIYIAPFSATVEADPAAAYVPVELGVGAEAVTTFNGVFQVLLCGIRGSTTLQRAAPSNSGSGTD